MDILKKLLSKGVIVAIVLGVIGLLFGLYTHELKEKEHVKSELVQTQNVLKQERELSKAREKATQKVKTINDTLRNKTDETLDKNTDWGSQRTPSIIINELCKSIKCNSTAN